MSQCVDEHTAHIRHLSVSPRAAVNTRVQALCGHVSSLVLGRHPWGHVVTLTFQGAVSLFPAAATPSPTPTRGCAGGTCTRPLHMREARWGSGAGSGSRGREVGPGTPGPPGTGALSPQLGVEADRAEVSAPRPVFTV